MSLLRKAHLSFTEKVKKKRKTENVTHSNNPFGECQNFNDEKKKTLGPQLS